jgi:hypothetical protein
LLLGNLEMLPHPGVPSKRHPAGCRSLLGCRFPSNRAVCLTLRPIVFPFR